jgi:hypothetical protein
MKKTLSQLKLELELLKNVRTAPEVVEAARKVLEVRKPQIEALEKEIESLRSQRPAKAPRWPVNTPKNVMEAAEARWKGTTEFSTFRIHMWNSKAFWTSYPSGGYSNVGGWNPTPACFSLISLTIKETGMGRTEGKELAELTGRAPKHLLRALMVEKTGEEPHDIG